MSSDEFDNDFDDDDFEDEFEGDDTDANIEGNGNSHSDVSEIAANSGKRSDIDAVDGNYNGDNDGEDDNQVSVASHTLDEGSDNNCVPKSQEGNEATDPVAASEGTVKNTVSESTSSPRIKSGVTAVEENNGDNNQKDDNNADVVSHALNGSKSNSNDDVDVSESDDGDDAIDNTTPRQNTEEKKISSEVVITPGISGLATTSNENNNVGDDDKDDNDDNNDNNEADHADVNSDTLNERETLSDDDRGASQTGDDNDPTNHTTIGEGTTKIELKESSLVDPANLEQPIKSDQRLQSDAVTTDTDSNVGDDDKDNETDHVGSDILDQHQPISKGDDSVPVADGGKDTSDLVATSEGTTENIPSEVVITPGSSGPPITSDVTITAEDNDGQHDVIGDGVDSRTLDGQATKDEADVDVSQTEEGNNESSEVNTAVTEAQPTPIKGYVTTSNGDNDLKPIKDKDNEIEHVGVDSDISVQHEGGNSAAVTNHATIGEGTTENIPSEVVITPGSSGPPITSDVTITAEDNDGQHDVIGDGVDSRTLDGQATKDEADVDVSQTEEGNNAADPVATVEGTSKSAASEPKLTVITSSGPPIKKSKLPHISAAKSALPHPAPKAATKPTVLPTINSHVHHRSKKRRRGKRHRRPKQKQPVTYTDGWDPASEIEVVLRAQAMLAREHPPPPPHVVARLGHWELHAHRTKVRDVYRELSKIGHKAHGTAKADGSDKARDDSDKSNAHSKHNSNENNHKHNNKDKNKAHAKASGPKRRDWRADAYAVYQQPKATVANNKKIHSPTVAAKTTSRRVQYCFYNLDTQKTQTQTPELWPSDAAGAGASNRCRGEVGKREESGAWRWEKDK